MAGLDEHNRGIHSAEQYRAVAEMRWCIFLNSLRTRRGSFDLAARVAMQVFFGFIGVAIGLGLGFGAWQIASHSPLRMLAALLWPVLVAWQFIPLTIASFQENTDLSILLRFPVNFTSYFSFYILFGLFDIGTLVGGIALFGIWSGVSIAQPQLILWITIVLGLFAAFNVLLTRMIFSWIERWLAQRRTREILGGASLFLMLALQVFNPALHQSTSHHVSREAVLRVFHTVDRVQVSLPPGLAAKAIAKAHDGNSVSSTSALLLLAAYAAAAGTLLGIRLRAEYRGENLGQAPVLAAKPASRDQRSFIEGHGPIAAVIEKEIRYIMRSGVMLYGFLAPLFIVFLFSGGSRNPLAGQFALPICVAYSFLGLTRFIYNNLGGEGAGIQLYFMSPTPIRKVILAKNIMHTAIFLAELSLVCIILIFRIGAPSPRIIAVTFCWLLFAVPAQLGIGNVLSITMAYRMNMTRMSREQGAGGNGLISVLAQLAIFAIGAAVYIVLAWAGHVALAAPVLLVLALAAFFFWLYTLSRAADMAESRRENLIAVLYRAA